MTIPQDLQTSNILNLGRLAGFDSNSEPTIERCSKFFCGFHKIIKTVRQSLWFAYVSQVVAYERYVFMR